MGMPGRKYTAGSGYRYGFNGKENDNEVKGEGNQQDYGERIYDPRLGKFLSVDPLMGEYPMLTPYQFGSNSPIAGTDRDGLEFYYSADGKFLGKSGTSQMVFTADKVEEKTEVCADGTSIKTLVASNSKSLNIEHNKFQIASKIVMMEGLSQDPNEYLNIAHANNNEAKSRKNSNMYKLLMSGYSSVPKKEKTALSDKIATLRANASRAGVISALTGATDPTGNARLWDGTDFLAWGLKSPDGTPQNKFEEYATINIPSQIYQGFLKANTDKFGLSVTYHKNEKDAKTGKIKSVAVAFSIPAEVFSDKNNLDASGNFSYSYPSSNGTKTLTATATAGQSIFWKISK